MSYRKYLAIWILLPLCIALSAQDIRIGLFDTDDVQAVVFSTVEGEYMIAGDGQNIAVARKGSIFHIERSAAGLAIHDTLQSYGAYNHLEFIGTSSANIFLVKPVFPPLSGKETDDNLSVSIFNDALRLINQLHLEKYISGTVEAEGGTTAYPEYYKAQAVIVRTFALRNFHRHAHEGFNLCDGTHCQAYKGKSRMNALIYAAANDTRGEVLVNNKGEPAITAYHACCGGITAHASVEWNRDLPYLMPVNDPFCNESTHRNWTQTIPLNEWTAYLEKTGFYAPTDNLYKLKDAGRQKYLDEENERLPLTGIRKDLKLRSSYFHITRDNGEVTFHGHGYGHGLGMCQEGAMQMAKLGYCYVDILMFYYNNVKRAFLKP